MWVFVIAMHKTLKCLLYWILNTQNIFVYIYRKLYVHELFLFVVFIKMYNCIYTQYTLHSVLWMDNIIILCMIL